MLSSLNLNNDFFFIFLFIWFCAYIYSAAKVFFFQKKKTAHNIQSLYWQVASVQRYVFSVWSHYYYYYYYFCHFSLSAARLKVYIDKSYSLNFEPLSIKKEVNRNLGNIILILVIF